MVIFILKTFTVTGIRTQCGCDGKLAYKSFNDHLSIIQMIVPGFIITFIVQTRQRAGQHSLRLSYATTGEKNIGAGE